jgi:glc operon protein GlcG
MKSLTPLAAALALAATFVQTPSAAHEHKTLSLDAAKKVLAAGVAAAKKSGAGGAFAIVDDGGHLLCMERLDGTFPAAATVSVGKARTAALFRKPTKFFEEVITVKGRTSMLALADFTPLQGGVPLSIDGQVVGAIGVSGAMSAQQDEELANAAAEALKGIVESAGTPAPPRSATFIAGKEVAAAFQKGAPLIEVEDYKVHASRRDAPGMAEVHFRDTDVIYVLDGTATFVTGGSVVEPKTTAADEVRGKAIAGGETRRIGKGDVVVVPRGTPHWFQEVPGPLTYYVVKVSASLACAGVQGGGAQ